MNPLRTAARAMLAALYIESGWRAYRHPEQFVERAKPVTNRVAPMLSAIHPKAPTDAHILVKINGAVQVVGGVMLASGQAARPGALLLAGTLAPTTFAGHRFWEIKDPAERAVEKAEFLKSLSMLGGLLITAMDTAGQPGLAWRTGYVARETKKSVRRTARDTRRSVGRVAADAQHTVSQVGKDAQLSATRAAAKATGAAGLVTGVASNAAGLATGVAGLATGVATGAATRAAGAASRATGAATGVAAKATGAATGVAAKATDAASRAADVASDTANRAAGSVGRAAAVAKARALQLTGS